MMAPPPGGAGLVLCEHKRRTETREDHRRFLSCADCGTTVVTTDGSPPFFSAVVLARFNPPLDLANPQFLMVARFSPPMQAPFATFLM